MKLRPMQKDDRRKKILPTDRKLAEVCMSLRQYVENQGSGTDIVLHRGIYKQKDPEAILTISCDGVEVGYKIKPCSPLELNQYYDRWVYLKIPGYRLYDLTNKQLASIKTAIYTAFFEPQMSKIQVDIIADDALVCRQRFMVAFWKAGNPNIVKTLTGVDVDEKGIIH